MKRCDNSLCASESSSQSHQQKFVSNISWNMLKVLRLTTNNLRNFSLFQLNKLFKQAATNRIFHNTEPTDTDNAAIMSTAETNGSPNKLTSAAPQTQNLDGMVKFLELLGNLKVSKYIFNEMFIHISCDFMRNIMCKMVVTTLQSVTLFACDV